MMLRQSHLLLGDIHSLHRLAKEQKVDRVRIAKQLLKKFPKYKNRSFANIITGDETGVNFYEPRREIQNKI